MDEGAGADHDVVLEPVSTPSGPRRRALWGALAVAAILTGTLAVLSGGDDDTPPRLPIGDRAAAEGAASTSGAAADMALAWVHYVAGDDLPALGGEATAYRMRATVDEAAVRALATLVGLDGTPVHEDRVWRIQSEDGMLEVIEDGTGSWWYSSEVRGDVPVPGGSGGAAGCDPEAEDCTVSTAVAEPDEAVVDEATAECREGGQCTTVTTVAECSPDGVCTEPAPPPVEPPPAADLPSEDEARQIALDLLAATGADVTDATVTVEGPYDAWYVQVGHRMGGVEVSGWSSSVAVGPKGVVLHANGSLAEPEALGEYPLLDSRAAIDRLNEQQGAYGYDGVQRGEPVPAIAEDEPVSDLEVEECKTQPDGSEICSSAAGGSIGEEPATTIPPECVESGGGSTGTSPSGTGDDPVPPDATTTIVCPEPVPTEPIEPVPAEPMEVVLTDAEPILLLVGAFDGSGDAYVVPGYRFSNAEGHVVDALAVSDEGLVPTTTVPETTETTATRDTTDPTEVPPPPSTECEVLVEDDGSGTTITALSCGDGVEPVPDDTVEPQPDPAPPETTIPPDGA